MFDFRCPRGLHGPRCSQLNRDGDHDDSSEIDSGSGSESESSESKELEGQDIAFIVVLGVLVLVVIGLVCGMCILANKPRNEEVDKG